MIFGLLHRLSPPAADRTPAGGLGHRCWVCGRPGTITAGKHFFECRRCEVRWYAGGPSLTMRARPDCHTWIDAHGGLTRVPFIDHGAVYAPAPA